MDWNLFWSAFGAIGTTFGSLITAVAVIVAVYQYIGRNVHTRCNLRQRAEDSEAYSKSSENACVYKEF